MHTIDVNCDMGEKAGNNKVIMPYISSANKSYYFWIVRQLGDM